MCVESSMRPTDLMLPGLCTNVISGCAYTPRGFCSLHSMALHFQTLWAHKVCNLGYTVSLQSFMFTHIITVYSAFKADFTLLTPLGTCTGLYVPMEKNLGKINQDSNKGVHKWIFYYWGDRQSGGLEVCPVIVISLCVMKHYVSAAIVYEWWCFELCLYFPCSLHIK